MQFQIFITGNQNLFLDHEWSVSHNFDCRERRTSGLVDRRHAVVLYGWSPTFLPTGEWPQMTGDSGEYQIHNYEGAVKMAATVVIYE